MPVLPVAIAVAVLPALPQALPRWERVDQPGVEEGGILGVGLAFDDETLIAGAPHAVAALEEALQHDEADRPAGSVTFFDRDPVTGAWQPVQWTRPSLSTKRDRFGVSIVLDEDTAFIGAPSAVVGGLHTGAVFRFERVQGRWVERQVITSSQSHDFAGFGNHLAYDGQQLIVGAPFQDGSGIDEWGHGFVFERDPVGGDWRETGVLVPPPMPDSSWAGYRVAIDGDWAALGLFGFESGGEGAGAICLFRRTPVGWVPVQQVLPSVSVPFSHFSYELILSGDLLIAGAYRWGPAGHHHGAVDVFRRTAPGAPFVEVQRLVPPGLEFGAVMGVSCALLDDGRLAAGIAGAHGQSGRVALYAPGRDGTFRLEGVQYPPRVPVGASFGWKLATDGARIAASAPREVVAGERRGAVYAWHPDRPSYERPHCLASFAAGSPRPVHLRSHGALDEGGDSMRLTVSEVPPSAAVHLLVSPVAGAPATVGCLTVPFVRVQGGPATSDDHGECTWWVGGSSVAASCTVGSTWRFQVLARGSGQVLQSNALDVRFR